MQERTHYRGEFEPLLVDLDLSLLQPMAVVTEVILYTSREQRRGRNPFKI
jgi:hypothetical protein